MELPGSLYNMLNKREKEDNLRMLPDFRINGVQLAANDYLNFSKLRILESDLPVGSGGSRLISGNFPIFHKLENEILPQFHQSEAALFFNSGYVANLGLISALAQKNDILLYDQKVHASIRDGMRLGFAKHFSFKHNDMKDLEHKLKSHNATVYVIAESIYSMDGDQAPLADMVALCNAYNAKLIIDEAHALGVIGKGLGQELRLENEIFARVFTYGKALGLHGASVCGSMDLIRFLINFSRPFIYTTAASPAEIERLIAHLMYFESEPGLNEQKALKKVINAYARYAAEFGHHANPSAIQFIRTGSNQSAKELERKCNNAGYLVKAIKHPTVAKGDEGIRICLHSQLSPQIWPDFFNCIQS